MTAVLTLSRSFGDFLAPFGAKFSRWFLISGYSRAHNELRRLGYHKEADALLVELAKLK